LCEDERCFQALLAESYRLVERPLIDKIMTTRLDARYREQRFASSSGLSLRQESMRIKALESAQRRLMQATKTLEQIRTMTNRSARHPAPRLLKTADACQSETIFAGTKPSALAAFDFLPFSVSRARTTNKPSFVIKPVLEARVPRSASELLARVRKRRESAAIKISS
jgi:hypothetical protein